MACTKQLLEVIAGWLPRHFIGAILISLPAIAVFSHFTSEFENNIYVSHAGLLESEIFSWGSIARSPSSKGRWDQREGWGCGVIAVFLKGSPLLPVQLF